jgi:purine-binding chemotaxis protein CheW
MGESALANDLASTMAGKYLTFMLGPETYGIEILCVQEIIGLLPVTRIPSVPEHIRGVINLRGKVIPVMSLTRRFQLPDHEDTALTCIIVIELRRDSGSITMGIVVDEVAEVIDIAANNIENPPDLGGSNNATYISGMGKVGEKVVILLDMSTVIQPADVATLESPVEIG